MARPVGVSRSATLTHSSFNRHTAHITPLLHCFGRPITMSTNRPNKPGGCLCCGSGRPGDDDEAFKGEAKVFGEKGGFWRLHDEITDKHDSDMMGRLNTGLDNLLIFVSGMCSCGCNSDGVLLTGWSVLRRQLSIHHRCHECSQP